MPMRTTFSRTVVATALACLATPLLAVAQAGFHQVQPRGSYLTASPADAPFAPLIINLTGLGNSFNLMPSGILRQAGMWSPDHAAEFCGVFASTPQLFSAASSNRVATAIGAVGAPSCVSQKTFYYGIPTDIAQDFFISTEGLTIDVPNGANYLMIAVEDSQYADNVTPDQSKYGVTVTSVVPEPSTYAMMALGVIGIACVKRRRRISR